MVPARFFSILIIVQVVAVLTVITAFRTLPPQFAGLIGGAVFLSLGLWAMIKTRKWKGSATFWTAGVYLLISVLPILIIRLSHWGEDFASLTILGMTGPEFHKFSEKVYLLFIAATFTDLVRARRRTTAAPEGGVLR